MFLTTYSNGQILCISTTVWDGLISQALFGSCLTLFEKDLLCVFSQRSEPHPRQSKHAGECVRHGRVSIPRVIHKTMNCWLELNIGPLLGRDFDEFCSRASDASACIWSVWLHSCSAVGVERCPHQCTFCSDSWLLGRVGYREPVPF